MNLPKAPRGETGCAGSSQAGSRLRAVQHQPPLSPVTPRSSHDPKLPASIVTSRLPTRHPRCPGCKRTAPNPPEGGRGQAGRTRGRRSGKQKLGLPQTCILQTQFFFLPRDLQNVPGDTPPPPGAAAWLSTPCPSRPTGLRLWVREAALAGRTRPAASPSRPPTLAAHHPLLGRGPALPPPTPPSPISGHQVPAPAPGDTPTSTCSASTSKAPTPWEH